MRKSAIALTATLLTAALGTTTAVAAGVVANVSGSTKDVVVNTTSNRSLGSTGGAQTTIASVTLPSGSWVLSLNATLVNFGPSDYVRCFIYTGGTALGGATATVGDPTAANSVGAAALVNNIAFTQSATLSGSTVVTARCFHDSSNGSTPYVDASSSLIAHKSASLVQLFQ